MPLPPKRCSTDGCLIFQPCPLHPRGWASSKSTPLPGDWKKRKRRVRRATGEMCYVCGVYAPDGEVDHIVPRAEHGAEDYSNYDWICRECHKVKSHEESKRGNRRRAEG